MKKVIWVLLLFSISYSASSQYYLRGEIKDNRGHVLEGVKINLSSLGSLPYYSGRGGAFGISVSHSTDTIFLQLDGFETIRLKVDTRKFQQLVMKMLPSTARLYTDKLASATTNLKGFLPNTFSGPGESYSNLVENNFIEADEYPETGFALNVDKASYSNIRRFLGNGMKVPKDAVRIEEMLNYFNDTDRKKSASTSHFNCITKLTDCPWDEQHKLLFLNIHAPKLNLDSIPPSNLVFLIDISGSMDKPNRLPLLQSAFKLLAKNLREEDTITVVTYGGGVGIALPPTGGNDKKKINDAIDSLTAGGDTPGENAIRIAYDLAKKTFIPKGNNRVILATDGDFNVGIRSETELEDMIIAYKQTGIYLTCLGVGMGNYKDSKLESLSKKGNGNFAYIDNLQEAQKVLVTEFTQTLYAVANNAFLKINFLPSFIKEYRLIGFDNKKNAVADSSSELEGGEVGSGHTMMAIFEVQSQKNDSVFFHQPFASITIQYKALHSDSSNRQNFTVVYEQEAIASVDSTFRFAAAVAMFGSVLKQSKYLNNYQLEDVYLLAKSAVDPTDFLQKEFLALIKKAIDIYNPVKRKRKLKND
ncbi:MAG: VWA domain-containing protein [Chitinophagaceae bacterium]|nr:VWA domain-containing protein [Chitinophagaceae bacterium]